jgi:hypothetical protein
MTIYAAIAQSVLPILPLFGVGGPSFTGSRVSGGTPSADPTIGSVASQTLYFIPAATPTFGTTFPEVLVWGCAWLVFGALGVDVQDRDVFTDGSVSYRITGQPVTYYGFLLGPAARI